MRRTAVPIGPVVITCRKRALAPRTGTGPVRAALATVVLTAIAAAGVGGCDGGGGSASSAGPEDPVGKGQRLYAQACATCHGFTGQGMPHQGAALRTSPFVASQTDGELVEFVKAGRTPEDPKSTMKLLMPPKGGVPGMTDQQLQQVVAFLRRMQKDAGVKGAAPG